MNKIAIIGGGITGLAVAYMLSKQGKPVTVYEKSNSLGGLAGTVPIKNSELDKYYRHIFPSHRDLIEIISSLQLKHQLIFKEAQMGYFSQGEIYPLNSPFDLLRFKPLNFIDRLRVGLSASSMMFAKDWKSFDNIGVEDFLKKKCGKNGFKTFWEPLLKNKFGNYSPLISATWLWDRLTSRTRSRKGKSSEALGYLLGSFDVLFERMADEIEQNGGEIIRGYEVSSIETTGASPYQFYFNNDTSKRYHQCIVTLPVPEFISISPKYPADYINDLSRINYAHSICMILQLKKSLSPFYWLNIGDNSFPFALVVEHTNWMDRGLYDGNHIVYLSQYVDSTEEYTFNAPNDLLFGIYCRFLKKIFNSFDESDVISYKVSRDRFTQPVFKKGFSQCKPFFETPLRNLFLVNTSQFYPRSRCMNTSFGLANEFISYLADQESVI